MRNLVHIHTCEIFGLCIFFAEEAHVASATPRCLTAPTQFELLVAYLLSSLACLPDPLKHQFCMLSPKPTQALTHQSPRFSLIVLLTVRCANRAQDIRVSLEQTRWARCSLRDQGAGRLKFGVAAGRGVLTFCWGNLRRCCWYAGVSGKSVRVGSGVSPRFPSSSAPCFLEKAEAVLPCSAKSSNCGLVHVLDRMLIRVLVLGPIVPGRLQLFCASNVCCLFLEDAGDLLRVSWACHA
ncbi:hypothetical protein L7F22_013567 [Adiantum nelumboides]|nr:hypothetical protein [Adiantum nelumboides]